MSEENKNPTLHPVELTVQQKMVFMQRVLNYHQLKNGLINENEDTILHYACEYSSLALISEIILMKLYNCSKNKDGNTPLHTVAMTGNVEVFNRLTLDPDVNPFEMNNATQTPLDIAIIHNNQNIIMQYLAKYGRTAHIMYKLGKEMNNLINSDDGVPFDMKLVKKAAKMKKKKNE